MASNTKKTLTAKSKKKTASGKNTKKEALIQAQSKREIIGVVLVALGLFLSVSLYSDAVGVIGEALKNCFFGIFGVAGYAAPVALIAAGILVIIKSENEVRPAVLVLLLLGVLSVLSVLHIMMRPYSTQSGITVISYYGDAYTFGTLSRLGGGIMGALIAYPAQILMGEVGSYILFTAVILIVILAVTKLSLRDTAAKVSSRIKERVDTSSRVPHSNDEDEYVSDRKSELYTATLSKEENKGTRLIRQKEKKTLIRRKKQAQEAPVTVKSNRGELELMPTSGMIERKKNVKAEETSADTYDLSKKKGRMEKRSDSLQRGPAPLLFGEEQNKFTAQNSTYDNEQEQIVSSDAIKNDFAANSFTMKDKQEYIQNDDFEVTVYDADTREAVVPKAFNDAPLNEDNAPIIKKNTRIDTEKALAQTQAEIENKEEDEYVYERPPFSLMKAPDRTKQGTAESPQERARLLERTFESFNIQAKVTNVTVGPVITRFELQPAQGVRVNKITTLSNDIALSLAASRVRIEAPIPGKAAIGIEVPNKSTAMVYLREIVENEEFLSSKSPITFALGKDIAGKAVFADLDRMPHLLIAGSTGSGKSVCINDIIISMAYKATPDEVRMILVDPKVVELKMFSTMPHLLLPVVTDPKKAAGALKWAVLEMEQRYQKMSQLNARDLARYNTLVEKEDRLPKIVIVIDELADLMMVAAKDVEESICRIAQLGRASGIHLIVATQRPSTDVITGLIKANIPSRIAFMVSSAIDSRVILDCNGAEKLLGKGDMLFHANGANKPTRVQCAFIGDEEVESIMDFFGQNPQGKKEMLDELAVISASSPSETGGAQGNGKQEDELLGEAVKIVLDSGQASISMIQRRLRVGYARAARLIDIMEQKNIVSGFDGSKPRKLLIDHSDYERMFGGGSSAANNDGVEEELD